MKLSGPLQFIHEAKNLEPSMHHVFTLLFFRLICMPCVMANANQCSNLYVRVGGLSTPHGHTNVSPLLPHTLATIVYANTQVWTSMYLCVCVCG